MTNSKQLILGLALTSIFASSVNAQTLVSRTVVSPGSPLVSVNVENDNVFCSAVGDGMIFSLDASNPYAPIPLQTFNPSFSDQWNESYMTGGMLYSGHRWGGLAAVDTINPAALDELHAEPTAYHHVGLTHFAGLDGNNVYKSHLFYSEHNVSGGPGGLLIYDITTKQDLVLTGKSLDFGRDGGNLAVTSDGYVYQMNFAPFADAIRLNVYDAFDRDAPAYIGQFPLDTNAGNAERAGDVMLSSDENYLVIACGRDGANIVDISNRTNPVVVSTVSAGPGSSVLELAEISWPIIMVSSRSSSGVDSITVANMTNPLKPKVVLSEELDFLIYDLTYANSMAYVAGWDPNNLEGILEIWE